MTQQPGPNSRTRVNACRVCAAAIVPFMTFGRMPLANGFLSAEAIADEYFYELMPAICTMCGTFQLVEQPAPELMFNDRYPFFSRSSGHMQAHFSRLAHDIDNRFLRGRRDPLVVELGSNDGTLLRHFRDAGYRHLGIEPSGSVAAAARAQGLETLSVFFDERLAGSLRELHGPAQVVVAANVVCHIPDIHSVAAGISRLLATDGVLIFEEPYLGDMVAKTSYDQIYDEHVFMLSLRAVSGAFGQHGLEVVDVTPIPTHGGSMRYRLVHRHRYPATPAVDAWCAKEQHEGLGEARTYDAFRGRCEASRAALVRVVEDLCRNGKRIAGYGATSKSTTIMNYCALGRRQIEFVVDSTPAKQGKLTPGTHIPIRPSEVFRTAPPDYAILFAWNHAAEILAKEQGFANHGGQWLSPLQFGVQSADLTFHRA